MSASPLPTSAPDLLDEEEDDRLDREAIAEMEEKGSISWEAVKRWMQSWGKPDELPPPQIGD